MLEIGDQWLGGIKGLKGHPGSSGILLFFRLFLKEAIQQNSVLEKYDRFVVTRSDFMHRIPHVPLRLLDDRYIWIPYGEDYGGFTDRHIVVHRRDVLTVLSVADQIIANPKQLYSEMRRSNKWNLEKFIKLSFENLNLTSKIRRFPYTMYTVKSPDAHTRWANGYFHKTLGYNIKYQSEYLNYRMAALIVNDNSGWNSTKITSLNTAKFLHHNISRSLDFRKNTAALVSFFKRVFMK